MSEENGDIGLKIILSQSFINTFSVLLGQKQGFIFSNMDRVVRSTFGLNPFSWTEGGGGREWAVTQSFRNTFAILLSLKLWVLLLNLDRAINL